MKKKIFATLILSLVIGASVVGCRDTADTSASQVQYEKTENVVKVFFWYGCPHCYAVHKEVKPDSFKNLKIEYIAVPGNKVWTYHASIFYTLKRMNLLDTLNEPFFDFVQANGSNPSEGKIIGFMEAHGVNIEDYKRVLHSDEVKHDLASASRLSKNYGVSGVPAIFMDGVTPIKMSDLSAYSDIKNVIHEYYKR